MTIVLDTETTGLEPSEGHRIVEIGMVEINDLARTGHTFQRYLNPDRTMPEAARSVHGLTDEFLADKPRFRDIVPDLLDFIGESDIVIHNAEFDLKFLNAELSDLGEPTISHHRVIDTLSLSRREFPKATRHTLDALCTRLEIDRSHRQLHGALLDAELLSEVYLAITGRGRDLFAALEAGSTRHLAREGNRPTRSTPLAPLLTEAEAIAHEQFVKTLGEDALWRQLAERPVEGEPK